MGRTFDEYWELTPRETTLAISGFFEREQRHAQRTWDQTRWISYYTFLPHTDKKSRIKPTDLMQFPWDQKEDIKILTRDAIQDHLKRIAKRYKITPKVTLEDGTIISGS